MGNHEKYRQSTGDLDVKHDNRLEIIIECVQNTRLCEVCQVSTTEVWTDIWLKPNRTEVKSYLYTKYAGPLSC